MVRFPDRAQLNELSNNKLHLMRKYKYNLVLKDTDINPKGELLTDKELISFKRKLRKPIETELVKVNKDTVFFCFGVRFQLIMIFKLFTI